MSTSARIAPDWIATLNSSERPPSHCSAMSRCPVLEIGRNSVMPSMMPRMTVLRVSDTWTSRLQSLRAIRARSGRVGAKAPPDIKPHQRNHRIHEEARLRAEYAAGQPRGSLEARLEQAPLWHSRAVRRADDEQLHVVESDVKADRKPQRAGPCYRVAHHQAQ